MIVHILQFNTMSQSQSTAESGGQLDILFSAYMLHSKNVRLILQYCSNTLIEHTTLTKYSNRTISYVQSLSTVWSLHYIKLYLE